MVSISSTFNAHLLRQYFCAKKLQSRDVTKENLRNNVVKFTAAWLKAVRKYVGEIDPRRLKLFAVLQFAVFTIHFVLGSIL